MKVSRFSRLSIGSSIAIILGLLFVSWPLLHHGFYVSDDGEWMVIRLSAFYQSLASGQFPVRFLGRLNYSYGYPVANFLYPGFLYIGSILHLLGLSFLNAIKMILISSLGISSVLLFLTLRKRFSRVSSIFGLLSFVTAPYLLYDLYVRGSVGEVLAISSVMASIYAITFGYSWLLAPAIGLLIVSHNTVAFISALGIGLFVLTSPHRVQNIISMVLGVGMASFFWMPALFERSIVRFDATSVSNPLTYLVIFKNAQLLGFATIISLALLLGLRKKITRPDMVCIAMIILGLIMALPISLPLWQIPAFSRLIQFPYRFLILPVVFGPWLIAFVLEHMNGWKRTALGILYVVLFLFGSIPLLTSVQYVDRPMGFYTTNEGTTTVANEYMPRWVSDLPTRRPVETLEILDGDAVISDRTFNGERVQITIQAREESLIQINKIFYPGWGVTIDNTLVPINYHNSLGVMQIIVPNGTHVIRAAFRETPFRFFADVMSLISGICFIIFLLKIRKHEKHGRKHA